MVAALRPFGLRVFESQDRLRITVQHVLRIDHVEPPCRWTNPDEDETAAVFLRTFPCRNEGVKRR